jgi:hypothetical protein
LSRALARRCRHESRQRQDGSRSSKIGRKRLAGMQAWSDSQQVGRCWEEGRFWQAGRYRQTGRFKKAGTPLQAGLD